MAKECRFCGKLVTAQFSRTEIYRNHRIMDDYGKSRLLLTYLRPGRLDEVF